MLCSNVPSLGAGVGGRGVCGWFHLSLGSKHFNFPTSDSRYYSSILHRGTRGKWCIAIAFSAWKHELWGQKHLSLEWQMVQKQLLLKLYYSNSNNAVTKLFFFLGWPHLCAPSTCLFITNKYNWLTDNKLLCILAP